MTPKQHFQQRCALWAYVAAFAVVALLSLDGVCQLAPLRQISTFWVHCKNSGNCSVHILCQGQFMEGFGLFANQWEVGEA